jgi:DNA polymerase III delta prime subunit
MRIELVFIFGMLKLLSLAVSQDIVPKNTNPYSFKGVMDSTTESVYSCWEWVSESTGLASPTCPYRPDFLQTVKTHLPRYITAQDEGIEIIFKAVAAWEFSRASGLRTPLVFAFTGPTGVGKTETAHRFAEAVLARKKAGKPPEGVLVFRGGAYSQFEQSRGNSIGKLQQSLANSLGRHLKRCGGTAVVIFDEVQKVIPGVLEGLLQALGERGEVSFYSKDSKGGAEGAVMERVSTADCIFIFISDIGSGSMINLLLGSRRVKESKAHGSALVTQSQDQDCPVGVTGECDRAGSGTGREGGGGRSGIPIMRLRKDVKAALEEHASTSEIARSVQEIIPFLPMERLQIENVLGLKLSEMSSTYSAVYWKSLLVDYNIVTLMSGPDFIKYYTSEVMVRVSAGGAPQSVRADFALYGARALKEGGPLMDLQSLLFRHMQPWRPNLSLKVGLSDRGDIQLSWCDEESCTLEWSGPLV